MCNDFLEEKIRKERHDFANHLNVIYGLCLLNKPDSITRIKDYVEKVNNELIGKKSLENGELDA